MGRISMPEGEAAVRRMGTGWVLMVTWKSPSTRSSQTFSPARNGDPGGVLHRASQGTSCRTSL